jgi:hypothetical protein
VLKNNFLEKNQPSISQRREFSSNFYNSLKKYLLRLYYMLTFVSIENITAKSAFVELKVSE